jgi:hypothetical protein
MAGRLFEAVEGISSGDDEPPVLEPSLPPLPNQALALPPPPNQALAPTRSTAVDSEATPLSSHPDTSAQTAKAASDAKSWLKPKAQSQLDVFKSEAAARAKAIQSGKVGAVHGPCGRGRGRGRSTSKAASSSLPPPSLPTNDAEPASPAPTVPYADDGIGGTHFSTTVRPMTHAGRFCPESGCD